MHTDWQGEKLRFSTVKRYFATKNGVFLHFSGETTTENSEYAWRGTRDQFVNLKQKFPFSRDFRLTNDA